MSKLSCIFFLLGTMLLPQTGNCQTYTKTFDCTKDTYIDSKYPTSTGGAKALEIYATKYTSTESNILVQWSLSSIPTGATINWVNFIYSTGVTTVGDMQYVMYPVSSYWSESSANWNNRPKLGSTFYITSVPKSGANIWKQPGNTWLRDVVQGWVKSPSSNDGLQISKFNRVLGAISIRSREYARSYGAKHRMKLEVNYTYVQSPIQISGKVVMPQYNLADLPLKGIRVSVSQGTTTIPISALTNANGVYSLTLPSNYAPGKYTIAAYMKLGSAHPDIFNYCQKGLSIGNLPSGDLTTLNAGSNVACDIIFPRPVILVHGFNARKDTWDKTVAVLRKSPLANHGSKRKGYYSWPVYSETWLTPFAHLPGNIPARFGEALREPDFQGAAILSANITKALLPLTTYTQTRPQYDLVCHSLGGLMGRGLLNSQATLKGDVGTYVSLGTLHLGTGWAPLKLTNFGYLACMDWSAKNADFKGAQVVTVGSSDDSLWGLGAFAIFYDPKASKWLTYINDRDDIWVPEFSANAIEELQNTNLGRWMQLSNLTPINWNYSGTMTSHRVPENHTELVDNTNDWFYKTIFPELAKRQ